MRWLIVLGLVCGGVRTAWATCSGCCHMFVELLGWSRDGKTIMVKEGFDEKPQIVVYTRGVEQARWGAADGFCGQMMQQPRPAMPANAYHKFDIVKLDAAWRTEFHATFKVRASTHEMKVESDPRCTTHEVVDANGKVVTRSVRDCDPGLTECIRGEVLGGYAHPSGKWLLVKTRVRSCGLVSSQGYELVRLPDA